MADNGSQELKPDRGRQARPGKRFRGIGDGPSSSDGPDEYPPEASTDLECVGPQLGKPPKPVDSLHTASPLQKAGGAAPVVTVNVPNKATLRNSALRNVLKVFVMKCDPNYAQPWQMRPQRSSSGSAFVICNKSRRILSNSHVITNATTVHVRRPGNPKKWKARVACEGRICDLALLTVDDDGFWEDDLQPLQFVDVPELQDAILVAGYPMGGDSLSITKGIVSRVTMTRYAHSSNKLLGIQIDAAINPGNSGGPAFVNLEQGLIAGVAFSKLTHADNVGYIIPYKIVCHFLAEYEQHGEFRGCCSLGFRWQDMENKHLKEFYGMDPNTSGSLVYKIDPLAPAANILQEGDIVLEVDGTPIADDGTVEFRNDERVEFAHLVRCKHVGDHLKLKILRERQMLDVSYELHVRKPLVAILHGVDCVPSYMIVGGLVLVALSIPFLEHAYGTHNWRKAAPVSILALFNEYKTFEGEQVVILFQVLAAEINFGYKFQTVRMMEFNGVAVQNLRHVAELVDTTAERHMKFGLEGGKFVVFDSAEAREAGPKILEQHAITYDRSADLRAVQKTAVATEPMPDAGGDPTAGGCK